MRSILFFPVLLLVVLAVSPVVYAIGITSEGAVPLDYTNAGTEIWPGTKVEIAMYAEGAKGVQSYAFASAGVLVGDVKIEITADPPGWGGFGAMPVYLRVYDGSRIVYDKKIDEIGFNQKKRYDAAVTLYWPCNGTLQISIQESYTGTQWHGTLDPGTPPVDIWYEDGVADPILGPRAESHVSVGESQVVDDCGKKGGGDLPRPGEGGINSRGNNIDLDKYVKWGLGIIAALGLLALLPSILRR